MEEKISKYNEIFLNPINNVRETISSNLSIEKEISLDNKNIHPDTLRSSSDYFADSTIREKPPQNHHVFEIIFLIDNKKIKYRDTLIKECCPIFSPLYLSEELKKDDKKEEILIEMPSNFKKEFIDNFFLFAKGELQTLSTNQTMNILLTSIYFNNDFVSNNIVEKYVIKKLTFQNVLIFLKFALDHQDVDSANSKKYSYWDRIISEAEIYLSNNIHLLFSYESCGIELSQKIVVEVLTMHFQNSKGRCRAVSQEMFKFILCSLNKVNRNPFHLLYLLFYDKFQQKAINNLNQTLPIIIEIDNLNEYQDFEISLDKIKIEVQVYKNPKQANHQITFKVKDGEYFIYSSIYFTKCKPTINFSHGNDAYMIQNKSKMNKLYIHLRIDYIFTAAFNFISDKITKYYSSLLPFIETSNLKLSLDFMKLIMRGLKSKNINPTIILNCILNLFDNSKEEIKEINDLFENVNFREVEIEVLCEFYLKFYSSLVIDKAYLNLVYSILRSKKLDKIIAHCAKKIKVSHKKAQALEVEHQNFEIEANESANKITKATSFVKMKTKSYVTSSGDEFLSPNPTKPKCYSYLTTTGTLGQSKKSGIPSSGSELFFNNKKTSYVKSRKKESPESKKVANGRGAKKTSKNKKTNQVSG